VLADIAMHEKETFAALAQRAGAGVAKACLGPHLQIMAADNSGCRGVRGANNKPLPSGDLNRVFFLKLGVVQKKGRT
jgi:hypothetical protein